MLPVVRRDGGGVQRAWSPWSWSDPMDLVQREFDRMFNRFGGELGSEALGAYPVDISEDQDKIYVEAELPGFMKEDVDVTLESGILTITAERKTEKQEPEKAERTQRHLQERRFTRVQRSFTLPTSVDEGNVEASLSDGVLHITLHKREEVKPRKITLK